MSLFKLNKFYYYLHMHAYGNRQHSYTPIIRNILHACLSQTCAKQAGHGPQCVGSPAWIFNISHTTFRIQIHAGADILTQNRGEAMSSVELCFGTRCRFPLLTFVIESFVTRRKIIDY